MHEGSGTEWILYTEFLAPSYDNCHEIDSVYLDCHKAFDSVSHNKILLKLWNAGFTGSRWHFLKAYLTDRRQCVVIDGHCSDWLPVISGVHQGSILGPLFFVLYINDLQSSLSFSKAFRLLKIQNVANEFLLYQTAHFYYLILIHFSTGALKVD